MIYICLFFRSLNLLNVIDYPSLDPFSLYLIFSDCIDPCGVRLKFYGGSNSE